jgi:hypothetical protein
MSTKDDASNLAALAKAFADYFRVHPEVGAIKVLCYDKQDGLLHDLYFSPPSDRSDLLEEAMRLLRGQEQQR